MEFDDLWRSASDVDHAYRRLDDISRKTTWDAVRRGDESAVDREELRGALDEARSVVVHLAADPNLWQELWTVPDRHDDE